MGSASCRYQISAGAAVENERWAFVFLLVISSQRNGKRHGPQTAPRMLTGHKAVACLALPELLAAARSPPGPGRRCCLPGWSPCAERVRLGCGAGTALSPSPGAGGQVARGAQNKPFGHLTAQPGPSEGWLRRLLSGVAAPSEPLGAFCFSGATLVSWGRMTSSHGNVLSQSMSRCGQGLLRRLRSHGTPLSWWLAAAGLAALWVVATSPSLAPCSRGRLPVALSSSCYEDIVMGLGPTCTSTLSSPS